MDPDSPSPLRFAFWPVRADIVRDNLARFAALAGESVAPVEIDGPYLETVEARLASPASLDAAYAQRGDAARWMARGLIRPLDDMPGAAAILARMAPGIVASSRDATGRLLGLTYYNAGPFCLFRNEAILAAAGLAGSAHAKDYPRDWPTILAQCRTIKRAGLAEHPWLPRWYDAPTGLIWNLIADAYANGDVLVDDALRPNFGPDTPLAEILDVWRALWDEELVPRAILDRSDSETGAAWMSGRHAFHPTMDYLNAVFVDAPESRVARCNHVHPFMPGRSGATALPGHALMVAAAGIDAARARRAWALIRFLGADAPDGSLYVHRRWIETLNLYVPFPELYADPGIRARMRGWMYPPLADPGLDWFMAARERAVPAAIVRAPEFAAWSAVAHRLIGREFLAKRALGVRDLLAALRAAWNAA